MRKFLFIVAVLLAVSWRITAAEAVTLNMTDGASFSGDIVKFDDNGVLLRATGDVYTNLPWGRFSQESLKQLTANPKIRPFVEVFIEPDQSQHPAKAEIKVNRVTRLILPEHPSIFGGLVHSSLGLFILLVVYLANLYAAYEVSIIRARAPLQVIGLAAVLPIIAPIIFLSMPIKVEQPEQTEELPSNAGEAVAEKPRYGAGAAKAEDAAAAEAAASKNDKKNAPQVFARGKFTFNKRFIETKFAGYIGELKGDALKFSMVLKTGQGQFSVERIAQVGQADAIFDTVERGQVTVPFSDIQEITLNAKTA